jgi:hypothetical protein
MCFWLFLGFMCLEQTVVDRVLEKIYIREPLHAENIINKLLLDGKHIGTASSIKVSDQFLVITTYHHANGEDEFLTKHWQIETSGLGTFDLVHHWSFKAEDIVIFRVQNDPATLPFLELHTEQPQRTDRVLLLDCSPRVGAQGLRAASGDIQQLDIPNNLAFADYSGFSGSSGGSVVVNSGKVVGIHVAIEHETDPPEVKKRRVQDLFEHLSDSSGHKAHQSVFLLSSKIMSLIQAQLMVP